MESEHKHARFSVFQIVDSHGFSRRRKNAPMNNIAAAVLWEHGENLLSALRKPCLSVSKAIYLVRLWWRRWDWRWFHVCQGELLTKSQFISLSRGATTMQVNYGEKAIGSLLLHCYIYYLSSDHSLFVFFWGDSTSQRKLTTNPFVRIPMNEPQWTLASTGLPLGRHHLQRWSGKSLKGRMAKKQLMLEAQFMPLVPRRATYTEIIHENIQWVGSFIYPNCDLYVFV